jgi:hypothetical protein
MSDLEDNQHSNDLNLRLTLREKKLEILGGLLDDASIDFQVKSRSAFAPLSPEQFILLVVPYTPQLLNLCKALFKILHDVEARVEPDSELELAKRFFADRWPFSCTFMQSDAENSYFVFRKGKRKFYWKRENGQISAGDLE